MKNQEFAEILQQKCDWSAFKNKNFLISGATGLIGKALLDLLCYLNKSLSLNIRLTLISRNINEAAYDNDYIKVFQHDVNFPLDGKFSEAADFVIHAASNTHPNLYAGRPIETITTNVLGSLNLLQYASKNPSCRFLFLSSVEVYGNTEKPLPGAFTEKDFGYIDCNTLRAGYPEAKRLSEALCQAFRSEKNIQVLIARLARCYGPGLRPDDSKVLSQFIRNAKNHDDIVLKSQGKQVFSYLYSLDAACAILYLLLKGQDGEAYNVAGKESDISLCQLAELIADLSGSKVIFGQADSLEKKGFSPVQNALLNTEKIKLLGWESKVSLAEGLKRTLELN